MISWFYVQRWCLRRKSQSGMHVICDPVCSRSSRPKVFYRKDVLRYFAKFTGKHLCQSLFFNKVACLRPGTLLKKRLWHRCFPVNFAKFLRTSFFTEHLRWLLLYVHPAFPPYSDRVNKVYLRDMVKIVHFVFTLCIQLHSVTNAFLHVMFLRKITA